MSPHVRGPAQRLQRAEAIEVPLPPTGVTDAMLPDVQLRHQRARRAAAKVRPRKSVTRVAAAIRTAGPATPRPPDRSSAEPARWAYRRPVTDAEVDDLVRPVAMGLQKDGDSFERGDAWRSSTSSSPRHFLFRVELAQRTPGYGMSQHELATRLSYFLWSSMPDEVLCAWPTPEARATRRARTAGAADAQGRQGLVRWPRTSRAMAAIPGASNRTPDRPHVPRVPTKRAGR